MSENEKSNVSSINETPNTPLDRASASMKDLTKGLGEIDALVRTIRDIATKTDLLALNASIEAARAGQAGKGFAIVADEVARLSEKVQQTMNAVEGVCVGLKNSAEEASSGIEQAQQTSSARAFRLNMTKSQGVA